MALKVRRATCKDGLAGFWWIGKKVDFVTDDTPSNSASGSCAWRSRVQMACKVVLARYVNGTAIPNSLRRSAQIHRGWLRTYRSSTRVNVKVLDFVKSGGGRKALNPSGTEAR